MPVAESRQRRRARPKTQPRRRAPATKRAAPVTKSSANGHIGRGVKALAEYDTEYLDCRDIQHVWSVVGYFRSGREIRRRLICQRCETEATDIWRASGERITRRYNYADGYNIKGGGVSRVDVRREVLHRVTVYATEESMTAALFRKGSKR